MYCPECRTELPDNAKFCIKCGYDFARITPPVRKAGHDSLDDSATSISHETHADSFAIGSIFANRYEILDEGKRGGMGTVYKCKDIKLGETIALKIINPGLLNSENALQRFRKEVVISRRLFHKNIVRVYNLEEWNDTEYFTMEWIKGVTLREVLEIKKKRNTPFSLEDAYKIISQLSDGLYYAHNETIHRDIKPENILIEGPPMPDTGYPITEKTTIKLTDFGIAKMMSPSQFELSAQQMGTPYYMAPEQKADAANVDKRADIYSMGVVLFELLTLDNVIAFDLPSTLNPKVPEEIDHIIKKAVATRPENRYENVKKFSEALSIAVDAEIKRVEEEKLKAEELKKQEEDRMRKEAEERRKKEEAERKRLEEEKRTREEAERIKQEEERKQKEKEQREKKEDAERKRREDLKRTQEQKEKEEAEKRQLEEEKDREAQRQKENEEVWSNAVKRNDKKGYVEYLDKYPDGKYSLLAVRKLKRDNILFIPLQMLKLTKPEHRRKTILSIIYLSTTGIIPAIILLFFLYDLLYDYSFKDDYSPVIILFSTAVIATFKDGLFKRVFFLNTEWKWYRWWAVDETNGFLVTCFIVFYYAMMLWVAVLAMFFLVNMILYRWGWPNIIKSNFLTINMVAVFLSVSFQIWMSFLNILYIDFKPERVRFLLIQKWLK